MNVFDSNVAKYMETPIGPVAIREHVRQEMANKTFNEIEQEALNNGTGFINPEYFAELERRRRQRIKNNM